MIGLQEKSGGPERVLDHEIEHVPVVDFEFYRQFCDTTDDFRKVGIQDEASYGEILQDERTVFIDYQGLRMPLLAPLEYEKMYNEERCLELSGKEKAMLLAVPIALLRQMELKDKIAIDDTVVIVEEFVPTDNTLVLDQHDTTDLPFTGAEPFDFKNPALSMSPPNETAWMAAYEFSTEPREGASRLYEGERLADDVMQMWHEHCAEKQLPELPTEHSTGTFLLSSEQLGQMPDIIAQLWEISQIGFGKILGEGHPVSMEFNEDFFYKQIVAENKITAIHCVDGQVECFSFVGMDMKDDDWLNEKSSVLRALAAKAKAKQYASVHVHELIGRGQKGMGYGKKILNTFFDVVAKTGYSYSVFFESTNMSSLYIPPLIKRSLERSETMAMTSDIETLGKLSYWGLVA